MEEERYVFVTSSAFKLLYPANQTFAFKSQLLTSIDNLDQSWEVCLHSVYLQNAKVRADSVYKVTVDCIQPYQCGESSCQIIGTFFLSGATSNQQTFYIQQSFADIKDAINAAANSINTSLGAYTKASEAERKAAINLAATCAAAHPTPKKQQSAPPQQQEQVSASRRSMKYGVSGEGCISMNGV